jgi:hypothetical protein
MQDVKPSSLYQAESDHPSTTAQISAEPSSAFDGDGEPRFDAARSSGARLHWRCHSEGECVRFREGPMPSCSGTCLLLAEGRTSGVETVRAELAMERAALDRAAYRPGASAEERCALELREREEPVDFVALLARASRFYFVQSTTLAAHFKSSDPTPWLELSAPTVRAWVAVAREAARS